MSLTYNILSNESIFSAMVNNSLPLDSIVTLMKSNDYELDTDFETTKGVLEYENSLKVSLSGGQIAVPPTSTVGTVLTNSTMNVFDVVLNTVGDLNKTIMLLKSDSYNFTNTNAVVDSVFLVNYNLSDVTDFSFKNASRSILYATGDNSEGHSFDYSFDYSFDS